MPTYQYLCRNCGHQFEVVQSISDDQLTICDECGGELRKVFSPVGIAFRGSGFYKTDSRSSKAASSSKSGSATSDSGSATSDSGSGSSGSGSSDKPASTATSST